MISHIMYQSTFSDRRESAKLFDSFCDTQPWNTPELRCPLDEDVAKHEGAHPVGYLPSPLSGVNPNACTWDVLRTDGLMPIPCYTMDQLTC